MVFTALERPEYVPSGAAHTFCHANGAWHAMGVMLSCGGAMRWARDTFFVGDGYEGMNRMAAATAPGAQGATFLPYLTGERTPHNDPRARGAIAGLTLGQGAGEIARSIFEGVSFGLYDGFKLLESLGASAEEIRVTGGGAKSELWLQILADLFDKPCVRLAADEGPAFGAAVLGGVGLGIWPNVAAACRETVQTSSSVEPTGADYSEPYARYQDLFARTATWNHGIGA